MPNYKDPFGEVTYGPNVAWTGRPRDNFHPPVIPANPADANHRREEAARIAGQAPGTYGSSPLQQADPNVGRRRAEQMFPQVPRAPEQDLSKYPDMKPRGFFGSFGDSYVRTPNFTQNMIELGASPEHYNLMHSRDLDAPDEWAMQHLSEEQRRKMYRPPEGFSGQVGAWAGRTAKKILDPVGIAAAVLTEGTAPVMAAGFGLEGGENALGQHLSGNKVNWASAAMDGALGAVGAKAGDYLGSASPDGVWGEIVGRAVPGILENSFKDTTKAGIEMANSYYTDPLAKR